MRFGYYPLGEIAEVVRGVSYSKSESSDAPQDDYLPILRAGNINGELILNEGLVYVPASKVKKKQRLKIGDIVMCTSSGSASVVGKTALFRGAGVARLGLFVPQYVQMGKIVIPHISRTI